MKKINFLGGLLCKTGILIGLVWCATLHAETPLPNAVQQQTLGAVNCASSTCHGSITPWSDSNVLQNEYTTWLRLDKHAKAYAVLFNDKSRSIVKNLGMKEAAHEAKVCLDCHTHNPAPALRGERYVVTDGITCEACHSPAQKWITSHTVTGATHAENVANGMYPTNQPVEQARLCLSCHFGDNSRFVNHRLMGAGHPRISFELETFSTIEPAHVRFDEDWHKRKGEYDSIKIWAIGQALASKQLLDILSDPKLGRDGLFPELVLFDCHSCHHSMSEKKWSPRLGVGPGRMRLNDSNLLMLRAIVRTVDPAGADAFSRQIALVHHAVAGNPEAKGADPLELAKKLSSTISLYITKFEQKRFDTVLLKGVLRALLDEMTVNSYSDYAGAEQAYMSVSSLTSSLSKQGGLKSVGEVNRRLVAMRKILANEDKFSSDVFGSELAALRTLISSQAR